MRIMVYNILACLASGVTLPESLNVSIRSKSLTPKVALLPPNDGHEHFGELQPTTPDSRGSALPVGNALPIPLRSGW